VLAGGLSSLRMEAAARIVSLDNISGREGFQKYPRRQLPAVELKAFWPDSYTRGYIYSAGIDSGHKTDYRTASIRRFPRNNVPGGPFNQRKDKAKKKGEARGRGVARV